MRWFWRLSIALLISCAWPGPSAATARATSASVAASGAPLVGWSRQALAARLAEDDDDRDVDDSDSGHAGDGIPAGIPVISPASFLRFVPPCPERDRPSVLVCSRSGPRAPPQLS